MGRCRPLHESNQPKEEEYSFVPPIIYGRNDTFLNQRMTPKKKNKLQSSVFISRTRSDVMTYKLTRTTTTTTTKITLLSLILLSHYLLDYTESFIIPKQKNPSSFLVFKGHQRYKDLNYFRYHNNNEKYNKERIQHIFYGSSSSKLLIAITDEESQFDSSHDSTIQNNMNNENDKNNENSSILPTTSIPKMIEKFQSYASNISRTRNMYKDGRGGNDHDPKIKIMKVDKTKDDHNGYHHGHGKSHNEHRTTSIKDINILPSSSTACMAAIRSLIYTLQTEIQAWEHCDNNKHMEQSDPTTSSMAISKKEYDVIDSSSTVGLRDAMNRALIQAIRASADFGDYNMIYKLIHLSISYAQHISKKFQIKSKDSIDKDIHETTATTTPALLLEARIFGEAITELQRTKASVSKLKNMWSLYMKVALFDNNSNGNSNSGNDDGVNNNNDENERLESVRVLATQPGAFELNSMLLALSNRGKVRAALSLYKEHTDTNYIDKNNTDNQQENGIHIQIDEFTASTLMTILSESIASDAIPHQPTTSQIDDSNKNKKSSSSKVSPCWQWREAESILDDLEMMQTIKLNNHVYAAALKVNEQASDLYRYPGNRHLGAYAAMSILERMKKQGISPDVVTCSAVMSAFDKSKQWKAALALLKSMEKAAEVDVESKESGMKTNSIGVWQLPPPNEYTYAPVISSCARCNQYDEAIEILDRIRRNTDKEMTSNKVDSLKKVKPNIWIYNAALAACVQPPSRHIPKDSDRSDMALKILSRMEEDVSQGLDTAPDIVTYNTIIAAIGGVAHNTTMDDSYIDQHHYDLIHNDEMTQSTSKTEQLIYDLMDKMKEKDILPDPTTYRNAMLSCRSDAFAAVRILDIALDDIKSFQSVSSDWGSIKRIKAYLINVCLSVCAYEGNMDLVARMFDYMEKHEVIADSRSMYYLIKALGVSSNCIDSMMVLNAMKGDGVANVNFAEKYVINIIDRGGFSESPMINEYHYSTAITGCLKHDELFPALKILNGMKVHGLKPNESSLKGIILAYCKLATKASSLEHKEARIKSKSKKSSKSTKQAVKNTTSRLRASAALAMMTSMQEKPFKLMSAVASACAAAGMWIEAREILWSMHISAVKEKCQSSVEPIAQTRGNAIAELPKLHTSLLKLCARSGNITAALWYADAIQDLDYKFTRGKRKNSCLAASSKMLSQYEPDRIVNAAQVKSSTDQSMTFFTNEKSFGMGAEEWKLVNIAASKSLHWKVCLGALQFIQPYIEATHPRHATSKDGVGPSLSTLNRQYESLARMLTDSILAFEIRSQYAWAIRAMDDWIEWSGRRPRRDAIFSLCRILSKRGLGNQVVSLVSKVLQIPAHDFDIADDIVDGIPTYESSYERALYTEAITTLFIHGLYDNADELYAAAASKGYLPWAVIDDIASSSQLKLDLHGMNKAIAHSAVRVSLQHLVVQSKINNPQNNDVIIITGKGKRSSQHLRPVLRPEVQRMLVEEFYPPLGTISMPGNIGALSISSIDVDKWMNHQQQQKGARFLAVADALKSLTSGERLRQVLTNQMREE